MHFQLCGLAHLLGHLFIVGGIAVGIDSVLNLPRSANPDVRRLSGDRRFRLDSAAAGWARHKIASGNSAEMRCLIIFLSYSGKLLLIAFRGRELRLIFEDDHKLLDFTALLLNRRGLRLLNVFVCLKFLPCLWTFAGFLIRLR